MKNLPVKKGLSHEKKTSDYQINLLKQKKKLNENLTSARFRFSSWVALLNKLLDGLTPVGCISTPARIVFSRLFAIISI